jgi:Protein of unknown function (DUF1761)
MFNVLGDINWLAVVAATVAYIALGGLWFTVFFGKAYAASLGREKIEQKGMPPIFIVGPAVCGLAVVITSAVLIRALGIDAISDGLLFGAIVGVGFLFANTVNIAINPNMPRPLFYGAISGSYNLVASVLISLIIVAIG